MIRQQRRQATHGGDEQLAQGDLERLGRRSSHDETEAKRRAAVPNARAGYGAAVQSCILQDGSRAVTVCARILKLYIFVMLALCKLASLQNLYFSFIGKVHFTLALEGEQSAQLEGYSGPPDSVRLARQASLCLLPGERKACLGLLLTSAAKSAPRRHGQFGACACWWPSIQPRERSCRGN